MDELDRLCERLLGNRAAAVEAAREARARGGGDRVGSLRAALEECRDRAGAPSGEAASAAPSGPAGATGGALGPDLAAAVSEELARACTGLEALDREALALRDLLGLSHEEIAAVLGVRTGSVAVLLARARVALRERLRGPGEPQPDCAERERALAGIERRRDGLSLTAPEEDWLIEHLSRCRGCAQAHAAVLEAAACYATWDAAA